MKGKHIKKVPDIVALSVVQPHAGVDAAGEYNLAGGVDDLAVIVRDDVRTHFRDFPVLDEDVGAFEGLVIVDNLRMCNSFIIG